MNINDITGDMVVEHKIVWRKSGNKVKRGVRCTQGPKQGRVVATASSCTAPVDIKKKIRLKRVKALKGGQMARKARRTKRVNPASKMVRKLNKS